MGTIRSLRWSSHLNTATIQTAIVVENRERCSEHMELVLQVEGFGDAQPGQFVHVCTEPRGRPLGGVSVVHEATLRRAFSIAGLRRTPMHTQIEIIYRVVGKTTGWMASLRPDDPLNLLGPVGVAFPINPDKPHAIMVAGGVGLPPMFWLAQALCKAGVRPVALCGARSRDLLPMTLDPENAPSPDGTVANLSSAEFAACKTPVVISTDDGSLGFKGHVGQALVAYHNANEMRAEDLTVYTCGPERMMRFVAEFCLARGIDCYVCMERAMACGMGTCQSCVIPVHDDRDADGWRYELCCTDGPVFDARRVIWDAGRGG